MNRPSPEIQHRIFSYNPGNIRSICYVSFSFQERSATGHHFIRNLSRSSVIRSLFRISSIREDRVSTYLPLKISVYEGAKQEEKTEKVVIHYNQSG